MRPLLIGLPGSGKSTTSALYAQKYGLKVVSTDALFRIYRAIPATSSEEGSVIRKRFLTRVDSEFPDVAALVHEAAKPLDDVDAKCKLSDSKLFRSFGEDVFRTYEIEMLKWLEENGIFAEAIPDLSASAPLYSENRELFSPKNGFVPVYIKIEKELLVERLLKDYLQFEETGKTKRGAYEIAVAKALESGNPDEGSRVRIVADALLRQSEKDRAARERKYLEFCQATITVGEATTPEDVVSEVERILQTVL